MIPRLFHLARVANEGGVVLVLPRASIRVILLRHFSCVALRILVFKSCIIDHQWWCCGVPRPASLADMLLHNRVGCFTLSSATWPPPPPTLAPPSPHTLTASFAPKSTTPWKEAWGISDAPGANILYQLSSKIEPKPRNNHGRIAAMPPIYQGRIFWQVHDTSKIVAFGANVFFCMVWDRTLNCVQRMLQRSFRVKVDFFLTDWRGQSTVSALCLFTCQS